MVPPAYVEHELPGRIRVRIPSRRDDVTFFQAAMERLYGCAEITAFAANPRTASILIQHSGNAAAIAEFAVRQQLFDIRRQPEAAPRAARRLPLADLRSRAQPAAVAALALSGLALYQGARGRLTGNALETFWMSYQVRKQLDNPWLATAYFGVGLYRMVTGPVLGPATSLAYYAATIRAADR
jgi:hypothetical protein